MALLKDETFLLAISGSILYEHTWSKNIGTWM